LSLEKRIDDLTKSNIKYFIIKELEKEVSDIEWSYRGGKIPISGKIKISNLNRKIKNNKNKILEYYRVAKDIYLSEFSAALATGKSDEYILEIFITGYIKGNGQIGSSFSGGYLFYYKYYPKQLRGLYFSGVGDFGGYSPHIMLRDLLKICMDCHTIDYNEHDTYYKPSAIELQAIDWFDNFFKNFTPYVQKVCQDYRTGQDFNADKKRALKLPDKFSKIDLKCYAFMKTLKAYSDELVFLKQKHDRDLVPAQNRLDIVDQYIATLTQQKPSGS